MENIMDVDDRHKCAHEECQCQVLSVEELLQRLLFGRRDPDEVEIECNCEHLVCALD
jgi:hypothetical protein